MIVESKGYVVATTDHPIEFWVDDEGGWTPYFSEATLFTTNTEHILDAFDDGANVRAMEVKLQLEV